MNLNCENCYQDVCMCLPVYSEVLALHGMRSSTEPQVAEPLALAIQTMLAKFTHPSGNPVVVDITRISEFMDSLGENKNGVYAMFGKYKVPKRGKTKVTMFNQIEIKARFMEQHYGSIATVPVPCETNFSIMLFVNGSIKITGVRVPYSAVRICLVLLQLCKDAGALNSDDITVENILPAMINTHFKITHDNPKAKINSSVVMKLLTGHPCIPDIKVTDRGMIIVRYLDASVESSEYMRTRGANRDADDTTVCTTRKGRKKHVDEISIMIYGTGSVSIVGTTNPRFVANAYEFLCDLARKNNFFAARARRVLV